MVGVLAVCSGGQRHLNISRVPFHELFHGANSGTCPTQEKLAASGKRSLRNPYFDSNGWADFDKGRQTAETIKNDPAGRVLNQNTGNACPSGASH